MERNELPAWTGTTFGEWNELFYEKERLGTERFPISGTGLQAATQGAVVFSPHEQAATQGASALPPIPLQSDSKH